MKDSEIAVQYMMNTYPCLRSWLDIVNDAVPNVLNYDAISCARLALISQAAMKTMDFIITQDANSDIVSVSRMLFDMHDAAWSCWTSFTAQSRVTAGTRSVSLTPSVLQAISTFDSWDSALDPSPSSFNPPTLLNTILQGVTA
jgi:hypothetical protein